MQINNVVLNSYTTKFKGCAREYKDNSLRLLNETEGLISTYTTAFRPDIDWKNLAEILNTNFKDKDKVNVYSLACSDGSEAYSIAILIKEFCKQPKKYFPILAKDRDAEIINFANNRRINLSPDERARISINSPSLTTYFDKKESPISINGEYVYSFQDKDGEIVFFTDKMSYSPNDDLKNSVFFEQEEIIDSIQKIEDNGNSIIFCRNVFPYLSALSYKKILGLLLEKLKPGSLFIIGEYDMANQFRYLIEKNGFQSIGKCIYKRI